jgi:hypothetical protein
MIEIGKNGMVKTAAAVATGLPIFDFTVSDNPGVKFDYCSKSQLALLEIYLIEHEQQNYIIGFVKAKGYRGVMPLYSLEMIRFLRGI